VRHFYHLWLRHLLTLRCYTKKLNSLIYNISVLFDQEVRLSSSFTFDFAVIFFYHFYFVTFDVYPEFNAFCA